MTFGNVALAQDVPSSADPGRMQSPLPKKDGFKTIKPVDESTTRARAPELSPEIAQTYFLLKSIKIENAKAFPKEKLNLYFQHDLGREITVSRLFEIMVAIQQLYQDEGYTLSKIYMPEQNIKDGDVVFQVIEGFAAEVDIDPKIKTGNLINGFTRDVLSMRPLNTRKLERLLLILNDRPGLPVASVISPVDDNLYGAGAVKISLKLLEDKAHKSGYISFNNYGSNFSGPGQFNAGWRFDKGLPNYSDLNIFAAQTTSSQEMRQGGFAYEIPIFGASGANVNVSASMTGTKPGSSLDELDVEGRSNIASLELTYPIIRQREKSWVIGAGLNLKNVSTNILHERLFDDRIRSIFFDTNYSFSDEYKGLNTATFTVTQGLDILGARETGAIDLSREDGRSDFQKAEFSVARLQAITPNIDLLGRVTGQYTREPLLSSEEFGFGGNDIGRGYDPSEITGDKGFSLSLEARYNNTLPLKGQNLAYQLYTFYDFGKVWNLDQGARNIFSGASAGVGSRLWLTDSLSADVNFAIPLTKSADNPPKYSGDSSPRALISLKYQF